MNHDIQFAQEIDRFQIFPAAEFVGQPFTLVAGIVQVEHGCDRIHAQSIKMEFR